MRQNHTMTTLIFIMILACLGCSLGVLVGLTFVWLGMSEAVLVCLSGSIGVGAGTGFAMRHKPPK